MSEGVQVALVSGIFLLLAALVALVPELRRHRKDVSQIKEQVQNSHGTNLRDDIDSLHRSVTWGFSAVHQRLNLLQDQVDVGRYERQHLADKIDELEKK